MDSSLLFIPLAVLFSILATNFFVPIVLEIIRKK